MNNRTIVIRKASCNWQKNTKRKIMPVMAQSTNTAGFISPVFIVLACSAFSALFYIYSVNQTAIKGIAIRDAEKEISQQEKNNEALKIKEAELKSLYHIEETSKNLNMAPVASVKYIEETPAVAYNR